MSASKYFLGAALVVGAVIYLSGNRDSFYNTMHAMQRLARQTEACVESHMIYRNLVLDCKSPVSFSDFRKLDMRADHRARSLAGGAKKIWITN